MRDKLNLSNLTKMTEKNLNETKGGIDIPYCLCYLFEDGTTDSEIRRFKG